MLTFQKFAWHLGIHAEIIILPQTFTQTPHPGISESTKMDTLAHACSARVQEHHSKAFCMHISLADLDKQWSAGSEPDWLGEAAASGYHAANFIGYSLHRPGERSIYIAYNPYKYPMQIDVPDAPSGKNPCLPCPHRGHNPQRPWYMLIFPGVQFKVGCALVVSIAVCTDCRDSTMHCSCEWCMRLACCPAIAQDVLTMTPPCRSHLETSR